ncbi:phosphotransferase [Streptomyces sp. NPDC004111]|uniref:phosphotransferase n=1 Tax=Streptomyces sp. NPDC004111 TaxID=3364690 RepID=UPI0036ADD4FB
MERGQLLGSGRSAEVFALDGAWVLRRLHSEGDATHEATVMGHLSAHGYPVPAIKSVDASAGLVMQRLYGKTMLRAWADGEISVPDAAATLAKLLHQLHAVPARSAAHPEDRILHLDLHPDNVMLTPHGPMVIDWCTTAEGPPGLDWAMSALLLAEAATDPAHAETGVAAGARSMLTELLGHLHNARELVAEQPNLLARATARRAADPHLSPAERARLQDAAALVNTLAS